MNSSLIEYSYPKQFILIEDKNCKIYKSVYDDSEYENIDEYLYNIVTSVTQKKINDKIMHLLQVEDKEVGWINFQNSIQIFRFQPRQFKVIEDGFQSNRLNDLLGIKKDFISHFKNKILTIRSEITFENEKYYSVFIKNKFHGFHNSKHLDPLIDCNIPVTKENLVNSEIYLHSDFTKIVSDLPDFNQGYLRSIFPSNKIGKLKLGTSYYWLDIRTLNDVILPDSNFERKTKEQMEIDDLMYSIEMQKQKSIDMLKTIISAKDYINNTDVKKYLSLTNTNNSKVNVNELNEELRNLKNKNLDLKRQLRKAQNETNLANRRLEQQHDYRERLEKQRDKYKDRMHVVEDKLSNLNQKYKTMLEKKSGFRKKFFK